jgi:hypothetical protein
VYVCVYAELRDVWRLGGVYVCETRYIHYTNTLVSLLLVHVDCRDEREVRLAKGTQRARLCVPCCVLRSVWVGR